MSFFPSYFRELSPYRAKNLMRLMRIANRLIRLPGRVPNRSHVEISEVGEMLWRAILTRDEGREGAGVVDLAISLADGTPPIPDLPEVPDLPDQRPGNYYVSCVDPLAPAQRYLVAGPFRSHSRAGVVLLFGYLFPSPDSSAEWVGWAALMFAHGRNSVMMRMSEKQAELATRIDPSAVAALVPCAREARFYLYAGETAWAYYFVHHHAWSGLAGVAVFTGYAQWRAWYTGRAHATR